MGNLAKDERKTEGNEAYLAGRFPLIAVSWVRPLLRPQSLLIGSIPTAPQPRVADGCLRPLLPHR